MTNPHFLLINDDGISSSGLYHLWNGVKDLGDVTIVAPNRQRSGSSQGLTLGHLTVSSVDWEGNTKAYKVDGTPVDCVKIAIRALGCKPTMILSGVNSGHNLGRTLLYSGTVGGIIEGVYNGIPGIAFSYFREDLPTYSHVEKYISPIVEYLLTISIPSGTFYNVNFPEHVDEKIKGFKLTPNGRSNWEAIYKQVSSEQDLLYHHSGEWVRHSEDVDTDCHYNNSGYITASPIKVSELTDNQLLLKEKDPFEKFIENKFNFNN